MPGLQSPGIGSGLDVNSIISQLMTIEQRPLLQMDRKEARYQADISSYGTLKSALADLQSSLDKLTEASTFGAMAATSSSEEVFTVAADTDAASSAYDVTVNRLAQRHKLGTAEIAGGTTFGGSAGDEMIITVGTQSFDIDLSTATTLQGIQAAINGDSNETGVTAGIITGDSGNQTLVLTAGETGHDNRVQLSYGGSIDPATFNFSTLNRDSAGALIAADNELDASLVVDGVNVTRSGNSIDDVVAGLTLTLKSEGQAEATITRDTSVAKGAVDGFIEAYNGLSSQISKLSSGSFGGSSMLRSVGSQIRNVLNQSTSGLGAFAYIQELGVTTGETGDLQLDSEMLISGLEDDPGSISAFFSDEDSGFANRLDRVLDGFLQSGGMVDSMIDGANSRIDDIGRRRDSLERRLVMTEQRLRDQFTALDTMVAQFSTTSEFLSRQLAILPNLLNNGNN